LGTLLSEDKYVIDPAAGNFLEQYVAWLPQKRFADFGLTKFNQFIDLLKSMSAVVVQMIENDYFSSNERVELAHVISFDAGMHRVWTSSYIKDGNWVLRPLGR